MTRFLFLAIVAVAVAAVSAAGADEPRPMKLTVVFRGMATEEDAAAVRKTMAKLAGVKVTAEDIVPGEKGKFGHYFSPPVVLEVADLNKTDVGHIGKAVAAVKTANRKDVPPPSLNLILFTPEREVNSDSVRAVRAAVIDVSGYEAPHPGGLGGVPDERRYWLRVDDSGFARLDDLTAALKKADLELLLAPKK